MKTRFSKPVALEVSDPTGAFEITQRFAPRLRDLNGETICELANGSWEFGRTFDFIRKLLQKQFPEVKIIPYTEFPVGIAGIDNEATAEMVKAKGGHGAIVGNAG